MVRDGAGAKRRSTPQDLSDLKVPPGNRLERLRGDRAGQHGIRVNNQWRICFAWNKDGPERVEMVDRH